MTTHQNLNPDLGYVTDWTVDGVTYLEDVDGNFFLPIPDDARWMRSEGGWVIEGVPVTSQGNYYITEDPR